MILGIQSEIFFLLDDNVEHVDEGVEGMKDGVLRIIRSCAQNDQCRQAVFTAVNNMLDDDTEGKFV